MKKILADLLSYFTIFWMQVFSLITQTGNGWVFKSIHSPLFFQIVEFLLVLMFQKVKVKM